MYVQTFLKLREILEDFEAIYDKYEYVFTAIVGKSST